MSTENVFGGNITAQDIDCDNITVVATIDVDSLQVATAIVTPQITAFNSTGTGVAGQAFLAGATNGTAGGATGGVGGAAGFRSGAGGGGTTTGGAGGTLSVTAGAGGNGVTTGGVGGNLNLTAGAAGTGGNVNGGSVVLTPGAKTGTGVQGSVSVAGPLSSPVTPSQSIADNGTIALPTTGFNAIVATSTAANKTGVILSAGTVTGQTICVINTSANSITFAASGTSRVADGVSAVIPALRAMLFTWEAGASLWYRQGA